MLGSAGFFVSFLPPFSLNPSYLRSFSTKLSGVLYSRHTDIYYVRTDKEFFSCFLLLNLYYPVVRVLLVLFFFSGVLYSRHTDIYYVRIDKDSLSFFLLLNLYYLVVRVFAGIIFLFCSKRVFV